MQVNIVTTEDLRIFKEELLKEIKALLSQKPHQVHKKWLKSSEVRRLLQVSPGTLQNLRLNGTLPFVKIGSIVYYDFDEIQKMMETQKFSANVF